MFYKIHMRLILLAIMAFGLIFIFAGSPDTASAAAARCYYDPTSQAGDERPAACSEFPVGTYQDDKCYVVTGFMPGTSSQEVPCSDPRFGSPAGGTTTPPPPNPKPCRASPLTKDNCWIVYYIVSFTKVLSGLVGIVIVIMITLGGIQYAAAGPDPGAVVAARKRIINALIALALYIFMFSFLQWLVPGGIF